MSSQIQIRTVKVELLRTGPSHNQLLSPLTSYLGICDGAEAGVVNVPFEHEAFLRRLRAMGVEEDAKDRGPVLRDLGVEIARMLGAIPRLPGSLSTDASGPDTLIHLRLVLSASELALLPFELSKIPIGPSAWAEGWLSLQVRVPVVITRRTRDTPDARVTWPSQPRVLFVAAQLSELGGSFAQHREALIAAVQPYMRSGLAPPTPTHDGRREDFEGLLTVFRNASFDDVVRECAEHHYTHIHLLAHGVPDENVEERSYGLKLRSAGGEDEIVSGERFASAFAKLVDGRIHRPTVVTMATCDSGNAGSVLIPGASMAHVLHQAGIPLVVASQFPLSMQGSELLVKQLYPGLLKGEHPLPLLHRIRSDLHGRISIGSNDWASLVVYEALPADLPAQLDELRYLQGERAVHNAFNQLALRASSRVELSLEEYKAKAARVRELVDQLPLEGPFRLECLGLRAGSRKRLAELSFRAADTLNRQALGCRDKDHSHGLVRKSWEHLADCYIYLEDARKDYKEAALGFLRNQGGGRRGVASMHWVLGQQMCLSAVLGVPVEEGTWETVRLCAETYLDQPDLDGRLWAHGTLAELWLLRLVDAEQVRLLQDDPEQATKRRRAAAREARHHATELIKLARERKDEQLVATCKQFERYAEWWSHPRFEEAAEFWPGSRTTKPPHWDTLGVYKLAEELIRILLNEGHGKRGAIDLDAAEPGPQEALPEASAGDTPAPAAAEPAAAEPVASAPDAAADSDTSAASATAGLAVAGEAATASDFLGKPAAARPGAGARSAFLSIEMLPAGHGDCLWIEYGQGAKSHLVLVDCGTDSTWRDFLKPRIERRKQEAGGDALFFELFVLTHIDDDHIGGGIELLKQAKELKLSFGDVWFNGWKHIADFLGAVQGEQFSELLQQGQLPWNRWTKGGRIVVPDQGPLPVCKLPGGLVLTLLSPNEVKLQKLARKWHKDVMANKKAQAQGLVPGGGGFLFLGDDARRRSGSHDTDVDKLLKAPFKEDDAPHNGSSITLLAEYAGKSLLLGADVHPRLLAASIERLLRGRGLDPAKDRLRLDAFKLPHHGSQNNLDVGLLKMLDCRNYLVSTDGTGFYHPDNEAIARIIRAGRTGQARPKLIFNYDSDENRAWQDAALKTRYAYDADYPPPDAPGWRLRL
jgi:hypothetical protein